MEDDYRPFKAVEIGLTSVETGQSRFSKEGVAFPPPVAFWRSNLTALSQRRNLYFVATKDTIVVYGPDFPFQRLRNLPLLCIPPAFSEPRAAGYIDEHVPHSINHLVVGDLGEEEILLLCTDSGNVVAYYTMAIEMAIRRDPYRFSTDARSDTLGLRPFFSEWVHESAWGLAIHTKARMIAVSANTPHNVISDDDCAKITVFAFALTSQLDPLASESLPSPDGIDDSEEVMQLGHWEEWESTGLETSPPPRHRNYRITLAGVEGHVDNIPSISFVNTNDDVEGNWLLSTDILGKLKIWQIWKGVCHKTWDFAERRMRGGFRTLRREGGWAVAALDPRMFRLARSIDEFCGHSKAPQYHGHSGLESYDLTHIVRLRTPGNSHAHPLLLDGVEEDFEHNESADTSDDSWSGFEEAIVGPPSAQASIDLTGNLVLGNSDSATPTRTDSATQDLTTLHAAPITDIQTSSPSSTISENASGSVQEADVISAEDVILEDASATSDDQDTSSVMLSSSSEEYGDNSSYASPTSTKSFSSLSHLRPDDDNAGLQNFSDIDSQPDRQGLQNKRVASESNDIKHLDTESRARAQPGPDIPAIPTLHCTVSNLRLMMTPQADSPHLFCANLLKQALPPAIEASQHVHLDRLNMMVQIPELGIVVIATHIGRCAVCTMTQNDRSGTLGIRVDWTLPTKAQELRGLRPIAPLLGIAASPLQGQLRYDSSSDLEHLDSGVKWGQDGVVDGIPATFDPNVLVIDDKTRHEAAPHPTPMRKRKRPSHCSTLGGQKTILQPRSWVQPAGPESWQAMGSSRRYRLMLTYTDMTVLTYELSRGVEQSEISRADVNSTLEFLD